MGLRRGQVAAKERRETFLAVVHHSLEDPGKNAFFWRRVGFTNPGPLVSAYRQGRVVATQL